MSRFLLDANVLISLAVQGHAHFERSSAWFAGVEGFALCPITEGALARFLTRQGVGGGAVRASLDSFHNRPGRDWWPDAVSYRRVDLGAVTGHRQVTDAYLAQLTRAHPGWRLATLDRGLVLAHSDVATLIPELDPQA
ncbi:MAG: VapC toxin family PIN domain ribonuclease [Bifidobacteriaceae bacterium]|jgi:predicted nucleic acid-binding protein|nr:VapC toxin family PIN domain ribonuclease [Bifidobacteriaceae bacterium]